MHDAVESFAADFGYDLDEEGQPLEDDAPLTPAPSKTNEPEVQAA